MAFDRGDYVTACREFCESLAVTRDLFVPQLPGADRPTALAGLGCVAVQVGLADRALRLFGSDARNAELVGVLYSAYLTARHEPLLETARSRVGPAAEQLWAEGATLAPDDVRAVALEVDAKARELSAEFS